MIKTQICCLIIVYFICSIYFSVKRKYSDVHRIFVALLVCTAINLLLDMLTVYTVNHLESIPASAFLHEHMQCSLYCIFIYYRLD